MKYMNCVKQLTLIFFVGVSLASCADGEQFFTRFGARTGGAPVFTGNTDPATANVGNFQKLAIAASEGSKQGIKQDDAPSPFGKVLSASPINDIAIKITQDALSAAEDIGNLPSGITETISGDCGGSLTIQGNGDLSSGVINFNNFCNGGGATVDGIVEFEIDRNTGAFTFVYRNVTVSFNGQTVILNATISCDGSGNCSFSEDFTSSSGTTYQTGDISVSGNNDTGYRIEGSVSDPDAGKITFVATGITICENGNIGSGRIDVTDTTGNVVITVTFPNCNDMVVTFNGVTETIPQP